MRNSIAAPVLLLFLATVGACITYEAIPVTEIGTGIKPGNHVIITTYAGDELRFVVQEVDVADRLVIEKDTRVPFDDVALIEHKRYG